MFRRLIVLIALAGTLFTAQIVTTPQKAEAAAIEVSATKETSIRKIVNRYVEIQVEQREPYCYGGLGPDCFDCSGLVVAAYRYAAINLLARGIRTSTQMRNWTTTTSLKYARTGDLLFYSGHVEIFYKKNGTGTPMAVSATYTGGPPVNFHSIRKTGLLKVGQVVT